MKINPYIFWPLAGVLLFLILYVCVFHDGFSSNSQNWGDFGSYLGAVSSLLLAVTLFIYTYNIDKRKEEQKRKDDIINLLFVIGDVITMIDEYNSNDYEIKSMSNCERGEGKCKKIDDRNTELRPKIFSRFRIIVYIASFLFNKKYKDDTNSVECVKNTIDDILNITKKEYHEEG